MRPYFKIAGKLCQIAGKPAGKFTGRLRRECYRQTLSNLQITACSNLQLQVNFAYRPEKVL